MGAITSIEGPRPGPTPIGRAIAPPFPPEQLRALYGTPEGYLAAYRKVADDLVAERWILPADAERMLAAAADVTF